MPEIILIVDDTPANLSVLVDTLSEAGYQLMVAEDGEDGPTGDRELGIDPVISGIDSNVGYTRLYGSHISWRNATTPTARSGSRCSCWQCR